jgi:hypothetical protein
VRQDGAAPAIDHNFIRSWIIAIFRRWNITVLRFAWAFDYLASRAVKAARGATLTMPDIDPAALSRPSVISTTPILPPKTISASSQSAPKVSKSNHVPARIDLEPLYTALKLAIGEHWATYKESISLFVMG